MERQLPELNTVIRTFANEVEAHVAQAVLDANGIDSNLIRDDAGGMMPWLQWLHPIRLVVRETDSIEAVELLEQPPGPTLLPRPASAVRSTAHKSINEPDPSLFLRAAPDAPSRCARSHVY